MQISQDIHNHMVDSVLHTKIKFFEQNTHGRIVNRFNKDIASVDNIIFTFLDMSDVRISNYIHNHIVPSKKWDNCFHYHNAMSMDVNYDINFWMVPHQDQKN